MLISTDPIIANSFDIELNRLYFSAFSDPGMVLSKQQNLMSTRLTCLPTDGWKF
jgi:hypothetical protein